MGPARRVVYLWGCCYVIRWGRRDVRRWCGCQGFQWVRRKRVIAAECSVQQVASGFGGCGEIRSALHPPHGKGEWRDHKGAVSIRRQYDTEARYIAGMQADTIEPVGNVNFAKPGQPVLRICVHQLTKDALQCLAKLHCFGWCEMGCFVVHYRVRVIHNQRWATISLRYDAQGR